MCGLNYFNFSWWFWRWQSNVRAAYYMPYFLYPCNNKPQPADTQKHNKEQYGKPKHIQKYSLNSETKAKIPLFASTLLYGLLFGNFLSKNVVRFHDFKKVRSCLIFLTAHVFVRYSHICVAVDIWIILTKRKAHLETSYKIYFCTHIRISFTDSRR